MRSSPARESLHRFGAALSRLARRALPPVALVALASLVSLASLVLGVACSDASVELFVDVQTDLAPGTDFDQVSTELLADEARPPIRSTVVSASSADDFLAGRRVAEFAALAKGAYTLRVSFLLGGSSVVSQRLLLQLDGDRAVIVEFEAACAGVVCPGPGDAPDATECIAGSCVGPSLDAGVDTGIDAAPDSGLDSSVMVEDLVLIAPTDPVNVNSSTLLGADGGVPPYTFSIEGGVGAALIGGDVLRAPNYGGTVGVRVTDSADSTVEATVTVGGASLFAIGGYYGMVSDQVHRTTDGAAWTSQSLPLDRGEVAAVVFDEALFIVGGYERGNVDSVLRSPTGETGSWVVAGRLPAKRGWGGAVVHQGRIIYAGGREDGVYETTDVFASPDGASWMKIGDLPEATTWGGLATFHGRLFYLGGQRAGGASDAIWTSTTGETWVVETATLPEPRAGGGIVVFEGRLWYVSGQDASGSRRTTVWSSSDGLDWVDVGFSFPDGFRLAGATVHQGRIWIVGGNSATYSASVYHSADGMLWTMATDLPQAVDRVGALSFTPAPTP